MRVRKTPSYYAGFKKDAALLAEGISDSKKNWPFPIKGRKHDFVKTISTESDYARIQPEQHNRVTRVGCLAYIFEQLSLASKINDAEKFT